MTITLHKNDLPSDLTFSGALAVDSETMGLNPLRDRLCVVQLSSGDGTAHLVQFDGTNYDAPNLKAVLGDESLVKIYHFARFDLAAIYHWLDVWAAPVFCTKIASKLTRTYTDRHGLKELLREMLEIEISKQQQSSDWGAETLSDAQQAYAASDVLYLHQLMEKLTQRLIREDRLEIAERAYEFLPTRAKLDLIGWPDGDLFSHS
ncbi:MAG: 3'-5' exonuclease [Rhodomicrobium sp.]|nr:MAG: 3'-5' exonuclease [Rhodomicrobium sp.]